MSLWQQELVKTLFTCLSGAIVLALGWFVGQRLTYQWNIRQRRREFQLSALQQFYTAYGEFFAVWKLWNRVDATDAGHAEKRWELHKRAAAAEAMMEGIFVKLASESELSVDEIESLGGFRQSFQQLRKSIRLDVPLNWLSSENPQYKTFKTLAVHVAGFLSREWDNTRLSSDTASGQLLRITSNAWEPNGVESSHHDHEPRSIPAQLT